MTPECRKAVFIGYLHGFSVGHSGKFLPLEMAAKATFNVLKYSPFKDVQFPDITYEEVVEAIRVLEAAMGP